MYLAHNSRIQKDKEGLVLAHAYNPSTEAELKSKAPGLHSKMTLHKKKKTNNSASSGASSAPMTEPPTPWLRQHCERNKVQQIHSRQQREKAKEDGSVGKCLPYKCEDQSSEPHKP